MSDERHDRIGVFGGTFDPVHHGHLRCALEVAECYKLVVHMIPSANPPHRMSPQASASQRLDMLRQAIKGQSRLIADDREIRRQGASYMVDTLASLKQDYPASSLYLILGQDAVRHLMSWHRWQQLFELANIIVLNRPGDDGQFDESLQQWLDQRTASSMSEFSQSDAGLVRHHEPTSLAISASWIRNMVNNNESIDYLTPLSVVRYINNTQLYRS